MSPRSVAPPGRGPLHNPLHTTCAHKTGRGVNSNLSNISESRVARECNCKPRHFKKGATDENAHDRRKTGADSGYPSIKKSRGEIKERFSLQQKISAGGECRFQPSRCACATMSMCTADERLPSPRSPPLLSGVEEGCGRLARLQGHDRRLDANSARRIGRREPSRHGEAVGPKGVYP